LRVRCGEIDAALSVHALGGDEVEIGERHSPRHLIRKNPERLALDSVVLHFQLVAIAVNEEGFRRLFGRHGRLSSGGATEVSRRLVFAHHFNFRRQVADLRGERVWFWFSSRRGRLVGLVPPRREPIGINRFKAQRGPSRIKLPAVKGSRIRRVQET
jgi:hypothetical protein